MKQVNKDRLVMQNILKNVYSKKRKCLLCEENSINSHLLQKNGILNNISYNGHIIQIRPKDFVLEDSDGILDIRKVGVNQGMSYFLFCNSHDTNVFKEIEQKKIDIFDYKSQLLFSYRSLCAENRKKEMNIDVFSRILSSSHFSLHFNYLKFVKTQKEENEMGNVDMLFYKCEFEKEIFDKASPNFIFELFEYEFIPLSASAVYTPINHEIHTFEYLSNPDNILNMIFINVIPLDGKLYILLGYHKENTDDWIMSYLNSWNNLSKVELSKKLSDLVSCKIETWAISPEYFEKINKDEVERFKKYWNEHAMDLRITQKVDLNLFNV